MRTVSFPSLHGPPFSSLPFSSLLFQIEFYSFRRSFHELQDLDGTLAVRREEDRVVSFPTRSADEMSLSRH